jgi:hypothetical protein
MSPSDKRETGKVRLFGNQIRWAKQVIAASREERAHTQESARR